MYIDTHFHPTCIEYNKDDLTFSTALAKIRQAGVTKALAVSTSLPDFRTLQDLVGNEEGIYLGCGIYPNDVDPDNLDIQAELLQLAKDSKVIAIGETGLEYSFAEVPKELQRNNLAQHLMVASELHKPIIIHSRGAKADTLAMLREHHIENTGGILHCFTEDYAMAKELIDLNMYISISGIVTFKNAQDLRETVAKLPLDRILLETDAPYLAPVPYRGKQNYPFYIKETYAMVASLLNVSRETLQEKAAENFAKLFHNL